MKRGWMVFLLGLFFAGATAAHAQASAYAEFSALDAQGSVNSANLYGGTVGILVDGPKLFHKVLLQADVNGRFTGNNGQRIDGATIGPRFAFNPTFFKIAPFVVVDVGFARYTSGGANSTASTDNLFGGGGGFSRQLTPRIDFLVDFKYEYYGYNLNLFNPRTGSIGIIYHFVKR